MIDYTKTHKVTRRQMGVIHAELSGFMFWRPSKDDKEIFEVKLVCVSSKANRANIEGTFTEILEKV